MSTVLFADSIYLGQKDFTDGTYIIDKAGTYILNENISFNPNSPKALTTDAYDSGFLLPSQYKSKGGKYDDNSFGIGFFAAIVIVADDVTLDLNGYFIEQSKEHALLQRFFAVIELADQPFIPGQGPHNFGDYLKAAQRVVIKNGTIGRSAHHGIHGNGNRSIEIKNIHFKDFEVAAAALNGVDGLLIENCTATSRKDVPVIGTFSAVRFLQPYLNYLVNSRSKTTLNIGGKKILSAVESKNRLKQAVDAVYEDLIINNRVSIDSNRHSEEYALFHNSEHIIDGNCYGFLINSFGQAVEGFPVRSKIKNSEIAKNIRFKNVHVQGLKGKVHEIIALNQNNQAMVDPVGAVFQVMNLHPDTKLPITITRRSNQELIYKGNLLANAQALVAKAYLNGDFNESGLDLTRLTISREVIDWIESDPSLARNKLASFTLSRQDFLCNADSMFHVNKGVVGFKIDGASNVELLNTSAEDINNLSEVGSDMCGYYERSHPKATLEGCGGPKTRGYSFAGSANIRGNHCIAERVEAICGSAVGFDILTDSENITIENSLVENVRAGRKFTYNKGPNEPPKALGFRISSKAKEVALIGICVRKLKGYSESKKVLDESNSARIVLECSHDTSFSG